MSLIPGAKIMVNGTENITDVNGEASFIVEAGIFSVAVSKTGYDTRRFQLPVDKNLTVDVNLTLEGEGVNVAQIVAVLAGAGLAVAVLR